MALDKRVQITNSPDPILERSPYDEAAPAKIAHVNEALRLIRESCSAVKKLGTTTNLTGTTVATLRVEVEARLDVIESKIDEIIASLS
tara:strand:- start:12961 stop:13224 length:264 start_codon:yes stop_codon:yes gene_type:complete